MPFKIAIVEDNLITLRSLMQTIDWAALDCEIAGTATNGQEGLNLCMELQPDILLTDISMPQMDGLRMFEELREEMPELKVIIITGYDQFQYASKAIKLSVFDYILKPIRNAELIESVQRAVREIRRMQEITASLQLRPQEKTDQSKYSLLTRNVLEYIRLHGAESLKLNDVAEHFQVSANYLSALISRETGTLFHAHVLQAKMDIAHTLLADPRMRVEEVARAVGYSNYVSFYNVFKRLEHMTPSQYREMLASQETQGEER